MEEHEEVLDELECGICMELYTEPCTLPCIHTFCRVCIVRHIVSKRQEHEKNKGFLCPFCRFYIRVPRPDQPQEQWAHQMPKNTKIEQIVKSIQKARLQSSVWAKCQHHPEESVISFCKSCNCVACSTCLKERHPSCTGDAFYTIREIGAKRKSELANSVQEIEDEVQRMTSNVDLVKSVMSGLKDAQKSLAKDIKHHTNISITTVTQEEAALLDKLDSAVDVQLKELRMSKNPADEAADILNRYREWSEEVMNSSTGSDYLDNVELVKERHRECMEKIQRLQSQCRPPTITFLESDDLSDIIIGSLHSDILRDLVHSEVGSEGSGSVLDLQTGSDQKTEIHNTYM